MLDADELAKALASDEYGAPPGLMRCLDARFRPAAALTKAAETARRRRQGAAATKVAEMLACERALELLSGGTGGLWEDASVEHEHIYGRFKLSV